MTKMVLFSYFRVLHSSHTHKQSIYVYTKKSFGISKFHRLLQYSTILGYILRNLRAEVQRRGENPRLLVARLSAPQKLKKLILSRHCVCFVLYHALFSLCSILLSHTYIISLLYLVKQHSYQAAKYYFFRFILLAVWYAFSFFFIVPPKIYSCEIFIDDRPAALFVFIL